MILDIYRSCLQFTAVLAASETGRRLLTISALSLLTLTNRPLIKIDQAHFAEEHRIYGTLVERYNRYKGNMLTTYCKTNYPRV